MLISLEKHTASIFHSENGGIILLQNNGNRLSDYNTVVNQKYMIQISSALNALNLITLCCGQAIVSVSHCFVTVNVEKSVYKLLVYKLDSQGLVTIMCCVLLLII